jgi:chemotaxis protein CheC
LELVSRLIGEEDADLETFSEMEQDALLEVGNIVLTSCIASFADLLELQIDQASLPEMRTGTGSSIFDETDCDDSDQENILFL